MAPKNPEPLSKIDLADVSINLASKAAVRYCYLLTCLGNDFIGAPNSEFCQRTGFQFPATVEACLPINLLLLHIVVLFLPPTMACSSWSVSWLFIVLRLRRCDPPVTTASPQSRVHLMIGIRAICEVCHCYQRSSRNNDLEDLPQTVE